MLDFEEFNIAALFGSDENARQKVISQLDPKIQKGTNDLVKEVSMVQHLLDELTADLQRAEPGLRTNYNDQYYRRAVVRALAATVEGVVFSAKQMTLATGRELNFTFSKDEEAFLKEERVDAQGKKRPFPTSRENIKKTFHLFAKAGGILCPKDFGGSGFQALCQTFELRHSLMHPKFTNFDVTDAQMKKAGEAMSWFICEIRKLVDAIIENSDKRIILATSGTGQADATDVSKDDNNR